MAAGARDLLTWVLHWWSSRTLPTARIWKVEAAQATTGGAVEAQATSGGAVAAQATTGGAIEAQAEGV